MAIIGSSGAKKSTLLEVLAGGIKSTSGSSSILVNQWPMNVPHFIRISNYVIQDDALFPLLTVEEMLIFRGRLWLPATKKTVRFRSLLNELGLGHISGSRIGKDDIRGISGSESQRVSIDVDAIHDPTMLLYWTSQLRVSTVRLHEKLEVNMGAVPLVFLLSPPAIKSIPIAAADFEPLALQ